MGNSECPAVFISYRREDSAGHAGRLFDRLAARLGHEKVFRDVDDIAPGESFAEAVRKSVEAADVLLVLIGPRWLNAKDAAGKRRLEKEDDLVRLEVAAGLKRNIRVVPILLAGASMPSADELPAEIAELAGRNAVEIRDSHFDSDAALLMGHIAPAAGAGGWLTPRRVVTAAAVMLVIAVSAWLYRRNTETPENARLALIGLGLEFSPRVLVDAAGKGERETVSLFLRAGMNADAWDAVRESTALCRAAGNGHLAVVRLLVEQGADVNRGFPCAGGGGHVEVATYLLTRKPDAEAMGLALSRAAQQGHLAMVEKLIAGGADVNYKRYGTALMDAAYYSRLEVVEALLNHGADVNIVNPHENGNGETALGYASRAPRPSRKLMSVLIAHGANVNAATRDGVTPLMNVLESRDLTDFLLAQNADINRMNEDGTTTLMMAAVRADPGMVKIFAQRGARINAQDQKGVTALMWASGAVDSVDRPAMVEALLDQGANPNLADKDGNTALLFAAENGNAGAIRVLVARGANPNAKNKNGESPLTIARKSKQPAVLEAFRAYRSK